MHVPVIRSPLSFVQYRNIKAVEGSKVLKAVSFVHNCFSEGCHFEELVTTVPIERELTKKYLFIEYCLIALACTAVPLSAARV